MVMDSKKRKNKINTLSNVLPIFDMRVATAPESSWFCTNSRSESILLGKWFMGDSDTHMIEAGPLIGGNNHANLYRELGLCLRQALAF
jgi:hypothetical protein